MCRCENVPMGSYLNQTEKFIPWYTPEHKNKIVGIDNCLLDEIEYLWSKGVKTLESCCGHNSAWPYICVYSDSIDLMVWLGYEFYYREFNHEFAPQFFKPKSV